MAPTAVLHSAKQTQVMADRAPLPQKISSYYRQEQTNCCNFSAVSSYVGSIKFFLEYVRSVWTVKNCKAGCISSHLAGYWEKFSISNNRASDEPH